MLLHRTIMSANLRLCFIQLERSDLVEGGDVDGLDKVLEGSDVLLKEVSADLVVLHNAADLQLLDAVADWNKLGRAPKQSVSLDAAHRLLKLDHVGLIVPGLRACVSRHSGKSVHPHPP